MSRNITAIRIQDRNPKKKRYIFFKKWGNLGFGLGFLVWFWRVGFLLRLFFFFITNSGTSFGSHLAQNAWHKPVVPTTVQEGRNRPVHRPFWCTSKENLLRRFQYCYSQTAFHQDTLYSLSHPLPLSDHMCHSRGVSVCTLPRTPAVTGLPLCLWWKCRPERNVEQAQLE